MVFIAPWAALQLPAVDPADAPAPDEERCGDDAPGVAGSVHGPGVERIVDFPRLQVYEVEDKVHAAEDADPRGRAGDRHQAAEDAGAECSTRSGWSPTQRRRNDLAQLEEAGA